MAGNGIELDFFNALLNGKEINFAWQLRIVNRTNTLTGHGHSAQDCVWCSHPLSTVDCPFSLVFFFSLSIQLLRTLCHFNLPFESIPVTKRWLYLLNGPANIGTNTTNPLLANKYFKVFCSILQIFQLINARRALMINKFTTILTSKKGKNYTATDQLSGLNFQVASSTSAALLFWSR